MSVQVRARREAAAFLSTFVGAQGELLVDTTNNRVQVHDGVTPGGSPAAKLAEAITNTRTAVADANYAVLASDRNVAITGLSAPRTISLPAASAYPTGTQLVIFDESGNCSAANTLTIGRAGSDTINGGASVAITTAYGYLALESNGVGRWTIVDQNAVPSTRTPVTDTNYTVTPTDRHVCYTAIGAARTVTLPAAAAYPFGTRLLVVDESGACSPSNTITLARAGSDTINGAPSAIVSTAYGFVAMQSNGVGKWTIIDQVAPSSVANNYTATTYPTSASDSTQGYAVGSRWLVVATGEMFFCRAATAGAAVWNRADNADFFGYVAGRWYVPFGISAVANGTAPGTGAMRLFPWVNKQRATLSALGVRITTASSGGSVQAALYAADPSTKRPMGSALAATVSMSTTALTAVNAAVSVQIDPGLYWLATNCDNATAAFTSLSNLNLAPQQLLGAATEAGGSGILSASLSFQLTQSFGTWPDMTSQTPSEMVSSSNIVPLVHFSIGSVP